MLYPIVFYAAGRAGATVTTLSALATAKDIDAVPKAASGKILRRELRAREREAAGQA